MKRSISKPNTAAAITAASVAIGHGTASFEASHQ